MRVYTGGTFDIFHVGHARLLRACRKLAGPTGTVIVGLNTDEFIRSYKGEHPVNSYDARAEVLLATRDVNAVIANSSGADSKPTLIQVMPDIIVIGSDWAARDYYKQMGFTQAWLDARDITLVYVPYTTGVSSTKLRRHLCD